jgi:hypothetical protein
MEGIAWKAKLKSTLDVVVLIIPSHGINRNRVAQHPSIEEAGNIQEATSLRRLNHRSFYGSRRA